MAAVSHTWTSGVVSSLCCRLSLSKKSFLSNTLTFHGLIWLALIAVWRSFLASFGHSYCMTIHPPLHPQLFSSSRLSCDSPDLILLPCVYERETKRRLEGRRHHLEVIIPLMTGEDIRSDVGFFVCLCRKRTDILYK